MKQKLLFLALFLFFGTGLPELKAQSLIVHMNDGTENSELLSSIQHLTFQDNNLLLAYLSGSTDTYGLSAVRKLSFDTGTASSSYAMMPEGKLTCYPNPAGDAITIYNIAKGTTFVSVYRADGRLMMQSPVSSETETMDVSQLQSGLFLLIANGRSAKFIKL